MQRQDQERRQQARLNIALPLHYRIRGAQEFGTALTKDISSGGISFFVSNFIKPQTRLTIELEILKKNIYCTAAIRWIRALSRSERYQVGLDYIEITPNDKNYISDFIGTHLPRQ